MSYDSMLIYHLYDFNKKKSSRKDHKKAPNIQAAHVQKAELYCSLMHFVGLNFQHTYFSIKEFECKPRKVK